MHVLLYTKKKGKIAGNLGRIIAGCVPENNLERYSTIAGLAQRLRLPTNNLGIAVIAAATKRQLKEIVGIRNLLSDIRVILIVPDRTPDTIAEAHLLSPRFLTYMDSDFSSTEAVLAKMLRSPNPQNIGKLEDKESRSNK